MSTSTDSRTERTASPPYVAFATFKNFIFSLSDHGIPSHVDKSVMTSFSGGVQSHLTSALRFLGLVNDDLTPTNSLETLVGSAGNGDWPETLGAQVKSSYFDLTDGLDLLKATPHQLDKCFESVSESAVMVDKTVRFYLAALEDANVEYSTHLKKRKPKARRRSSKSKVRTSADPKEAVQQAQEKAADPPARMIEYPIHFPGGRSGHIQVPKDITNADCQMIELLIPLLKMLAEGNQRSDQG